MMNETTPESTLRARLINGRPHRAVMVESADEIKELRERIEELEKVLIEAERDWEEERRKVRKLEAQLQARCDHSELHRTIRELQSENKRLKKQDKHREKLWKSRIEELEARIDELPDENYVSDLRYTIKNLREKLKLWAEYYINGLPPDVRQDLYVDTLHVLEKNDAN